MAQRIATCVSLALSQLHFAVKFLQFCGLLLKFPKLSACVARVIREEPNWTRSNR